MPAGGVFCSPMLGVCVVWQAWAVPMDLMLRRKITSHRTGRDQDCVQDFQKQELSCVSDAADRGRILPRQFFCCALYLDWGRLCCIRFRVFFCSKGRRMCQGQGVMYTLSLPDT